MPTFTISIPENPPEWCPVLITQLTQCLEAISNQMNDIDDKLCGKFDKLYSAVKSEICEVKKIATSAHSMAVANAAAIESLKKDLFNVNRKCNGLSAKNKRLTELQEAQDTYSRRENLVIRGVAECEAETEEQCVESVRQVLINNFGIDENTVSKMVIVRCHRIGTKDNNGLYQRPIIVRFLDYNHRKLVWGKRTVLANTPISVSENFGNGVEHRRKLLYPIMKKAKHSPNYQKTYIKGDRLVVDNNEYSLDDGTLSNLPTDLDPKQFSSKSNGQWIIFGGPHSMFNPLSNYYPEQVVHKGITHDTLEHAYQYAKASRYQDTVAEESILCAASPAEAKQTGLHVQNFDSADWDTVKSGIMLDLLRIKFAKGSEMAKVLLSTSGKSIAEAGKGGSFTIGLTLNSKNLFDTSKWSKNCNILGKCLMEVRGELISGTVRV